MAKSKKELQKVEKRLGVLITNVIEAYSKYLNDLYELSIYISDLIDTKGDAIKEHLIDIQDIIELTDKKYIKLSLEILFDITIDDSNSINLVNNSISSYEIYKQISDQLDALLRAEGMLEEYIEELQDSIIIDDFEPSQYVELALELLN